MELVAQYHLYCKEITYLKKCNNQQTHFSVYIAGARLEFF